MNTSVKGRYIHITRTLIVILSWVDENFRFSDSQNKR